MSTRFDFMIKKRVLMIFMTCMAAELRWTKSFHLKQKHYTVCPTMILHFQLKFWGSSGWLITKPFQPDEVDMWQIMVLFKIIFSQPLFSVCRSEKNIGFSPKYGSEKWAKWKIGWELFGQAPFCRNVYETALDIFSTIQATWAMRKMCCNEESKWHQWHQWFPQLPIEG